MRNACGILCLGLIAILLVSASMGLPAQSVDNLDKVPVCRYNGTANGPCSLSMLATINSGNDNSTDVTIQSWHGYATKDTESYQLRLNLERIAPVDPTEVRRLLASNTSLEDIQSMIRTEDGSVIRRGNMRLENSIYQLVNITVFLSGNRSVLDASIAGPIGGPRFRAGQSNVISVAGHTTLTISTVGGNEVAEGTLVMDIPDYRGTYQVLLNQHTQGRGRVFGPRP